MTNLVFWPDKGLLSPCSQVINFNEELESLVEIMFKSLYKINGSGLAANQVGVSKQVLTCFLGKDKKETVLVNPSIEEEGQAKFTSAIESCVSLPSIKGIVKNERFLQVRVSAQDLDGAPFVMPLKGKDAVIVQHGMDHLQGKTFLDYLSPLSRRLKKKKMQTFLRKHWYELSHGN